MMKVIKNQIERIMLHRRTLVVFYLFFVFLGLCVSQVKPTINIVGGDDVPLLKEKIKSTLETILLEMNRVSKEKGNPESIRGYFTPEAFGTFEKFVLQNGAYTARKINAPLMTGRESGAYYDLRSIAVHVRLGETEASDLQSLVFTFTRDGLVYAVRAVIPNLDYEALFTGSATEVDSSSRMKIRDLLEQFRMAYNSKDIHYLEQIFSEHALIIVGTVLREKKKSDEFLRGSFLSSEKIKLLQLSKQQYLDSLRWKAFRSNSFLNVRFEDVRIIRHEKIPFIYGVSCWQTWTSASYSDRGYLFLMIDFKDMIAPSILVRAWQPQPFNDGTLVDLYDFDIVRY